MYLIYFPFYATFERHYPAVEHIVYHVLSRQNQVITSLLAFQVKWNIKGVGIEVPAKSIEFLWLRENSNSDKVLVHHSVHYTRVQEEKYSDFLIFINLAYRRDSEFLAISCKSDQQPPLPAIRSM